MRRTKLINRVLGAQEPPPKRPEWRWQPFWCQYCGARFADRNELLAHLEAEKQQDQTAPEPLPGGPFHSGGPVSIGIGGTLPHHPRLCSSRPRYPACFGNPRL